MPWLLVCCSGTATDLAPLTTNTLGLAIAAMGYRRAQREVSVEIV